MAFPVPEPGLVISYSYLWRYEHQTGKQEGRKHRPAVIVLSIEKQDETRIVTVAPVTHIKPRDLMSCVEIPPSVKQYLGLDHQKSWVILNEVNQFAWPGYDLTPVPGTKNKFEYGFLPPKLFDIIKAGVLDLIIKRRAGVTNRD